MKSRIVSNSKIPCPHFVPVSSQPHTQCCIPEILYLFSPKIKGKRGNQVWGHFLTLIHWPSSLLFLLPNSVCSQMVPPWFLHNYCCSSKSTLSSLGSPQAPLPQCHDQIVCEYLQTRRLQKVPGQPLPLVGHPRAVKKCFPIFSENLP